MNWSTKPSLHFAVSLPTVCVALGVALCGLGRPLAAQGRRAPAGPPVTIQVEGASLNSAGASDDDDELDYFLQMEDDDEAEAELNSASFLAIQFRVNPPPPRKTPDGQYVTPPAAVYVIPLAEFKQKDGKRRYRERRMLVSWRWKPATQNSLSDGTYLLFRRCGGQLDFVGGIVPSDQPYTVVLSCR